MMYIKNEDHWLPKLGLWFLCLILAAGLFGAIAGMFVEIP